MPIYQILNFADPYTLEAGDFAAACACNLLLGQGHYALEPVATERICRSPSSRTL